MLAIVGMSENSYALAAHYYPCLQNPSLQTQALSDDIVLLHGWGSGSQSWQPLIPALQNIANVIALDLPGFGESEAIPEFTLDAVVQLIAARLPEKCVLIGWSLGGMLAVQIAARYPQKISRLITLATNAKFVASRDYETAMPLAVNRQFNKSFAADSQLSLKLFGGLLAQGDINERALLKQIRVLTEPDKINPNWLQALELLSQLDNREAFAQLAQPGLHLLAEKDVLVPASAATALTQLNSQQSVQVVVGAAHALHWSQPEVVVQIIQEFFQWGQTPLILGCSTGKVISCKSMESDPIEKTLG
jgi:malonyl-CoA O-methyltransferase